jgi:hypothetical protein
MKQKTYDYRTGKHKKSICGRALKVCQKCGQLGDYVEYGGRKPSWAVFHVVRKISTPLQMTFIENHCSGSLAEKSHEPISPMESTS